MLECDELFIEFLNAIKSHVWNFNLDYNKVEFKSDETIEDLAEMFNCEPYELGENMKMSSIVVMQSALMKIVNDLKSR